MRATGFWRLAPPLFLPVVAFGHAHTKIMMDREPHHPPSLE
ncbi:MAG: hypothetical protein ACRD4Y_07755 [Candidatus Acidiferrales bacterium]